MSKALKVMTIGHSTRTIEDFCLLLLDNRVTHLLDVRSMPYSRYCPQFNTGKLASVLKKLCISYTHLPEVGGLRGKSDNIRVNLNGGWRNKSFKNYADYMQTDSFKEGVETIIDLSSRNLCALMCSEAVPWRCHRSLIADALLARGARVDDIINFGPVSSHHLTPFAKVKGTRITYPEYE